MAYRLARSLSTLRAEVNDAVPDRSKRSDGWIGDPAHASRASRHNPNNAGVVCALDLTHDPADGCDIHALARRLVLTPHPELEYVISNGQVAKRRNGFRWERYTGSNAHSLHAHFAVGQGPDSEPRPPYDSTAPWGVTQEDDDMTPAQEALLREVHQTAKNNELRLAGLDQRLTAVDASLKSHATTLRDGLAKLIRTIPGVPKDG